MIYTTSNFPIERIKNKKVLSFDSDDTLVISKIKIDPEMADLVAKLLERYHVNIISGVSIDTLEGNIEQILEDKDAKVENMTLSPNVGTRLYEFTTRDPVLAYEKGLNWDEKERITRVLGEALDEIGYSPEETWGELIEDRGTIIVFSALGQNAPIEAKRPFDPDLTKRRKILNLLKPKLKDMQIDFQISGTTSIDVMRKGTDKAFGINELSKYLSIGLDEILFFGDHMEKEGNDHPVSTLGVDCIWVKDIEDTKKILREILEVVE